jgi:hypothetical protein
VDPEIHAHHGPRVEPLGASIQADTVRRLLEDMDYSLQVNRKVKEGLQHPDRDGQFRYINRQVNAFRRRGDQSFRWMPRSTSSSDPLKMRGARGGGRGGRSV